MNILKIIRRDIRGRCGNRRDLLKQIGKRIQRGLNTWRGRMKQDKPEITERMCVEARVALKKNKAKLKRVVEHRAYSFRSER